MLPPARPEEVTDLPDDIALVHHFVNTEDLRAFRAHGRMLTAHDNLATPADLHRWLREHELPTPGEAADEAHVAHARALRAALRAAIRGNETTSRRGDKRLRSYPAEVYLTERGAELTVPGDNEMTAALGRIVVAAVTATINGAWRRLKMCPAADCQWVFYDRSRPGRARWCSPQLCGNRMKTLAYRRRETAGRPGSSR